MPEDDKFIIGNEKLTDIESPKTVNDSFLVGNEKLNNMEIPQLHQVGGPSRLEQIEREKEALIAEKERVLASRQNLR